MTLEIIGAGFGRTGTMSLKLALERLGLGPCHHMEEVLKNPDAQVPLWNAAIQGGPDWNAIFNGYQSAVDWPSAAFWSELAANYPRAKVILTTRSAESWYESISGTILALMSMPEQWPPPVRPVFEMANRIVRERSLPGGLDRDRFIQMFDAHVDAVRGALPAERLLVFEVKEGWELLCKFVGKPVPPEPFPRTNSKKEFWELAKGSPR